MTDTPAVSRGDLTRKASWSRTVVRGMLICAGTVAILLPAWLPDPDSVPLKQGTVEFLQAGLLAAACAVLLGASAHAGRNRAVCRMLGLAAAAAVVGELEDFVSLIMGRPFPEAWVVGVLLFVALVIGIRHRKAVVEFVATLGRHAGAGFVGAALLIIYVFDRVIGSGAFWKAYLGEGFDPRVPAICKSYLELLACYLIFIGSLGLAITMARRKEDA
ncbi:MAG: hypothetical protein MUF04_10500 [Akkermansiaceae bacterium]|nr:hypothetical protein [Akkermansiaceae bacterium]